MANVISVSVLGDVRDINRKLGSVDKQLSGFGKSAGKIGSVLKGAFAGAVVVGAFKNIVKGASDAQQSVGATQAVFGKYANTVIASSNKAASAYGLSANQYRESSNLIGSMLANAGVPMDQLAGKTDVLIKRGADMAAVFGGTVAQATDAMGSALKGEFDPLEKYGVSLSMTKVNAELAARGQDKLTGKAASLAKQQVISDLIMKQSSKTSGQFQKQTNTLAEQQQILSAKFQNVKDKIGSALLPILTKFISFISSSALPTITSWGNTFQTKILPVLQKVGSFLSANVLPPLKALGDFMMNNKTVVATFAGVILTVVAAMRIFAAVQALVNIVLSANPIGIVVIAIAALAAGLVYAYKHSETFRNVVNAAFAGIKKVISAVMPVVVAIIKVAWTVIKTYITTYVKIISTVIKVAWAVIKTVTKVAWAVFKTLVLNPIKAVYNGVRIAVSKTGSAVSTAWNAAKTKTAAVWNGIKNAVSNAITSLMTHVKGIKGKITGAFSGAASWLVGVGKNIIQGMINGVSQMASTLVRKAEDVVGSAISAAKHKLGIKSPSRVFKEIGVYTVQGLQKGLENRSALNGVVRAAGKMTTAIGTGFEAPSLALNTGPGTGGNITYTINVKADATTDKVALGKAITTAIDAYERQGGSRRAK